MVKFLFFCLVIGNAVLFAFGRGYLGNAGIETHEPQRLLHQQNADQLTLVTAELATASSAASTPAVAKPESFACLEWGNFVPADMKQIEEKLKVLSFGDRQARQNVQETSTYIVFIPSQGSKEGADKKAGELSRLGIRDYFIVQEQSNLRWGISLGVFKSEEAAKQHLSNLTAKGVHSAKMGARTVATNKFLYQLRNVTGAEKEQLDKIKAEFPAQDLRVCNK